ncbi:hypothetical protein AB0F43_31435 [Kribbella sp. NPDC023972]|uniref:hypothetical protein n=1 Tax=Kribbella sp. NPDC023972 TaxID=3154795 RepID=UPI0033D25A00
MSKASQRSGQSKAQIARCYAARVGTAVLLSAAVVTLAACSPSLQLDGHEVDSKAPFLKQIEDQWRNDLGQGTSSTGDKAGCWLARDKDTDEFDRTAFCGPVRHLERPDAGVWDAYSFDATVSDKSVTVDNIGLKEMGTAFPANRQAYRADGADLPKNADQLAAPKAPPLPAGYVKRLGSENSIELKDRTVPKAGKIIAPNLQVTVTDVGRVDTISGEADGIMGPADGEELRAIVLTVEAKRGESSSSLDTPPVFSIQTQKGRKALDLTDKTFGGTAITSEPITIIAGVPNGQDAELVVGVAGIDQTLSLRTGERTSTTAAGYYRSSTTVALNKQFPTTQVTVGSFAVRHGVTFSKADIVPFNPTAGWAKPGKIWLQLTCTNVDYDKAGPNDWRYHRPVINISKSITFTDDKGVKIPYNEKDLPCLQDSYLTERTVSLEIPESTRSVRVNYAPTGSFSAADTGELFPKSGTFAFKPMTFTVTIPK